MTITLNPEISIIMPVYNNDTDEIERAINSVLAQDVSLELIVVDDGSKNTINLFLTQLSESRPCIRLLTKENGGVSSARNLGIKSARGQYITFIDADDIFTKDHLAKSLDTAKQSNADVVFCGMEKAYLTGKKLISRQEFDNMQWKVFSDQELSLLKTALFDDSILTTIGLAPVRYYSNGGVLYSASALANVRFNENLIFSEDSIFNWKVLQNTKRAVIMNDIGYIYFENSASATMKIRPNILKEMEPTALALYDIRKSISNSCLSYFDNGVYLYCFYRIFACSIKQDKFDSSFNQTKYEFMCQMITNPIYKQLIQTIRPNNVYAKIIMFLLRHHTLRVLVYLLCRN